MKKTLLIVITLALAGAGIYFWTGDGKRTQANERGAGRSQVIAVKTVAAKIQAMPVIIESLGTVEPLHRVEVRAQTGGVLKEVLFREGDYVSKGQLLFRIDERTAQAALDQARANLGRDQAQLKEAQAQRERLAPLAEKEFVTRQEYAQAAAAAQALSATLQANRAQVDAARVQLGYSEIRAPIAGRTGGLAVKEGNLISVGATTPLIVINTIQPVLAALNIPQQYLDEVRAQAAAGEMRVQLSREQGGPAVAEGKLVFIDNAVNAQTGTVLIKAQVANENEALWPGEFVAARIILKVEPAAVVVPAVAVQPSQQGNFVYVADNGVARSQPVEIDRQIDNQVVIGKGLQGGEKVIVEIPFGLSAGTAITLQSEAKK